MHENSKPLDARDRGTARCLIGAPASHAPVRDTADRSLPMDRAMAGVR